MGDSGFRDASPSNMATPFPEKLQSAELKADVVQACAEIARAMGARLPQNAGEERMHRNRMAICSLTNSLHHGVPLDDVAEQAVLLLVEQLARKLRHLVAGDEQLAPTISQLVHGDFEAGDMERVHMEIPKGPLGPALLRVVPSAESTCKERWKFLEDIIDVWRIERQFDRSSYIHQPNLKPNQKTRFFCGLPPPIWDKVSSTDRPSDFPRGQMSSIDKLRMTSFASKTYPEVWMRRTRPASIGPGHYGSRDPAFMHASASYATLNRRAEFPSVGKPRGICLVDTLSYQNRFR